MFGDELSFGATLSLFTIGAVLIFALFQWLKMRKELPDDHEVRSQDKLRTKQHLTKAEPTRQSRPDHDDPPTPPRQG
jgi:hypothetical protein